MERTPSTDRSGLHDRFVLGPVLGEGGFGIVYRALDRQRKCDVAIKKLHRITPHALYRFKTEFRSVADVLHPNLVRLHELRADGDDWYLVMELISGVPFLDWIRPVRVAPADSATLDLNTLDDVETLPPADLGFAEPRLRDALRQLCEGVLALHRAKILHRDIKPSNVLVTDQGRVVLLDFSLATELASEDQTRVLAGTPVYIAPEHIAHHALTEASDWYSVGVMLYEALTGHRPFPGTRSEILAMKPMVQPRIPDEQRARLPADLVTLCEELMEIQPERRPDGAAVLQRLGVTVTVETSGGQPFVGRVEHLRQLHGAFRDLGGRPTVVRLEGRSGMGKSALIRRFFRELQSSPRVVTLTGRCYEREAVPYKGLDSLMDALVRALRALPDDVREAVMPRHATFLARLFPVFGGVLSNEAMLAGPLVVDAVEIRRRGALALRELLSRLADRRRVALFIDDVQWSDLDSAALLAELLRPPDAPVVLLILACRLREPSPVLTRLHDLRAEPDAIGWLDLEVDQLHAEEVASLVWALAPAVPHTARHIVTESQGNPYFVVQLARRAQERGDADVTGASLESLIRERVAMLDEGARRLLTLVAVAVRPLPATVATRAAGLGSATSEAIATLRAAFLIRRVGDEEDLEAWHDRIREIVSSDLGEAALRAHHRTLAAALEGHGDADALAYHWRYAGDADRAAAWSRAAGDQALAALAFERAITHYNAALSEDDWSPPGIALRRNLANALRLAGHGREAGERMVEIADRLPIEDASTLRGEASMALLASGHGDRGIRVLSDALNGVGLRYPTRVWTCVVVVLLVRLWLAVRGYRYQLRPASARHSQELATIDVCWAAAIGLATFDQVRGAEFQARVLKLSLQAGEPIRLARALTMDIPFSGLGGSLTWKQTCAAIERARGVVAQAAEPRTQALFVLNQGTVEHLRGGFQASLPWFDEAEELLRTRCHGITWELDTLRRFRLRSLYFLGRFRELRAQFDLQVQDADARGERNVPLHARLRLMHVLRICADHTDGVEAELDEVLQRISSEDFRFQNFMHFLATVELALYRGDCAGAWRRVEQIWPKLGRSMMLRTQISRIEAHALRGRAALCMLQTRKGPAPGLVKIVQASARQLSREQASWAEAQAQALSAGLARVQGQAEEARRWLTQAEVTFGQANMAMHAAIVRWRLADSSDTEAQRHAAETWMMDEGIRNVPRWVALWTPGFDVPDQRGQRSK